MAGVAVVTDSTASLKHDLVEQPALRVIPLQVVVGRIPRRETSLSSVADSISPAAVALAMRSGRRVSTSRPSPEAFAGLYAELAGQGFEAVVSAHLSGTMSGTVESARRAAADAPLPVIVVDTRTIAMAAGFAVLSGLVAAEDGAGADEVAEIIRRRSAAASLDFCVASLDHLRRGGRIGPGAALLGSALAVKPLLTVRDGAITLAERVRTASKSIARLQERGVEAWARAAGHQVDVAVHHFDSPGLAEGLAGELRRQLPGSPILVAELSAVLGVHVGPGALGLVVSPRL